MSKHKIARTILSLAVVAGMLALVAGDALAAATVTTPATASVSSDSFSGNSVSLPPLVLTEGLAGDIASSTLTLALPSGFIFDTGSAANVAFTGAELAGSSTVSFPDSMHASVNVTSASTSSPATLTIGSTTPLKVKVASGAPATASGNITLSGGNVAGIATSTSFGVLTQIPGTANKLAFTVQPPATVTTGSAFGAAVSVEDQFGNVVTSDNSHAITLSFAAISPTTTTGTLSGILTINDTAGVSTFSGLSFSQTGTIALDATSSALSAALSNNIVVSATSTTPPTTTTSTTCSLRNGTLVKVQGSSTVYLVVNCVLRPFTTPASFYARGKKFKNVFNIDSYLFRHLGVGRNVGQGNDDDSTVVIPPAATTSSTPPTISGLPDGSIVKLPGNPTVYMVQGGVLQPFTSALVFNLRGKRFGDIKIITQDQFSQLTVGAPVSLPDGTLLKGSGKTVYMIQNGQAMGVTNPTVLQNHGKSFKDIFNVNDGDLNGLPHGGNVQN